MADIFVAISIWLAIVLVSMLIIGYVATRWGHDPFGWLFLAAVMGPIAIVALIGTRQREQSLPKAVSETAAAPGVTRIVVGCDGSDAGRRISDYVVRTWSLSAEVVLVAVEAHEAEPRSPAEETAQRRRIDAYTAPAREALVIAGIQPRTVVAYGNPGEQIVRVANDEGAAAIVVGRRGAGLTRALLGSVSDHVVRNASQPVVIVS